MTPSLLTLGGLARALGVAESVLLPGKLTAEEELIKALRERGVDIRRARRRNVSRTSSPTPSGAGAPEGVAQTADPASVHSPRVSAIDDDVWERQRRTFELTAEEYDRYRPSYPDALFEDVRAYADLAPDDAILEIGAGTGRATVAVGAWGNPLVAIEPAPAMADVARRNTAHLENVDVRTARFEDDDAFENGSFGLVFCAQVYHWLDQKTRVERLHDALYHYGTAAIIANVQVTPEETLPFWQRIDSVYREIAPAVAHQGEFRRPDDLPPHPLEGSELFVDLERGAHPWRWTLPTQRYVALLQTHSPHASLPHDVRARLIDSIAEVVDTEFGGAVTEDYVAWVALARRA